ncbi:hypothetical protein EB796_001954 [Bugula neritina]|uniref:Band 7 domain-containing protein n=1 Tax=Bugula neritina TaxID=10212 RepID=A0A7J7KNK0_BUGNE|nr:hypothetical protein EB796_001954 [Bugula neritina]
MKKKYGFVVINSGYKAIIYNLEGEARIVDGPQRLFLPCSKFRVPTIIDSIIVKKAITLDAHEAIIIYRHNGDACERTVDRYIEYGPKMFVPASNEWLHEFSWHGVDPDNKTRQVAGANVFTKLKLIPDQFYYNVDEIRTSDNGLVRVKLMIFHEIYDINAMLAATDDPIGDIISCITADITAFTAARTYVEFVEKSAELNELSNYPHLMAICKSSGVRVTKVVFRGYFAAPKIQASHDEAIDKRTNLQLEFEREQQLQEMKDREMSAEKDRLTTEHNLQLSELAHSQKLSKVKQKHNLEMQLKYATDDISREKAKADADITRRKFEIDQTLAHYTQLRKLDVALTPYILGNSAIPDQITKIVKDSSKSSPSSNVHLHLGTGGIPNPTLTNTTI